MIALCFVTIDNQLTFKPHGCLPWPCNLLFGEQLRTFGPLPAGLRALLPHLFRAWAGREGGSWAGCEGGLEDARALLGVGWGG